jgi:hypothetical protein
MDVWVRSEYAGEFAVLSAWVAVLLPWSASDTRALGGNLLVVRFPFFEVRYAVGLPVGEAVSFVDPLTAAAIETGPAVPGFQAWGAGAAVFALAFALSVVYYLREETVEAAPVDPVTAMGALLTVGSLVLGAASLLLFRGYGGLTLPVGVPLTLALGAALLLADRSPD